MQARPDPEGECPPDWKPNQWLAFVALRGGASYAQAGQATAPAVRPGTVSKWVRRWRDIYGEDIVVSPRKGKFTPEAREAGAITAGKATKEHWSKVRADRADDYATAAASALDLSQKIIDQYANDPARLAELTIADAAHLARASETFVRRAELLSGYGVNGAPPSEDPEGLPAPTSGLFDAFDAEHQADGDGGAYDVLLRQVRVVAAEIVERKQAKK